MKGRGFGYPLDRIGRRYRHPMNEPALSFSIATAVYNDVEGIGTAIDSVVDQAYPEMEYVVFDGGSTDGTVEVIRNRESRLSSWYSGPDAGQYHAIRDALNSTSGEIMGWLNSDDRYFPWTFQIVNEVFRKFPEVDWITGRPIISYNGIPKSINRLHYYPQDLIKAGACDEHGLCHIQQESTFWRRSLWEKVGGLNTDLQLAADFDLWIRFANVSPLVAVDAVLGSFHDRTGANRSQKFRNQYIEDVELVQQALGPEAKRIREHFIRNRQIYRQTRRIPLLRSLHYQINLKQYRAPIIRWNNREKSYQLQHRYLY